MMQFSTQFCACTNPLGTWIQPIRNVRGPLDPFPSHCLRQREDSKWKRREKPVSTSPARSIHRRVLAFSNAMETPRSADHASSVRVSSRVLQLPELSGDEIRHPLDRQNTALLRSIPGLSFIAESVMSPAAEKVLLLENISSSVLVGPDQLPSLYELMKEAAAILGMGDGASQPVPDLYVRQHPQPNAYTLAISGRSPFVVVHSSLLDLLTPEETQAVLAHELGHLKCNHGIWLTAANVLALGTVSLLPFFSGAIEEQLLRWLRAAELTCDRAALLVAQDPRTVVSALMKLAGGSASFANELNVDAFLRQARQYDEATSGPLGWYLRNAHTRALSHPLPVLRAREIDTWARSEEYRMILDRGRALKK